MMTDREKIEKILSLKEAVQKELNVQQPGAPATPARVAAAPAVAVEKKRNLFTWLLGLIKKIYYIIIGKKPGSAHDEVAEWIKELIKKILADAEDVGVDLVKLIGEVVGCDVKWPDYKPLNPNDVLHSVEQEPPPLETEFPESFEELCTLLEKAARDRQTVRGLGQGFVMSEVPFVKDLLISFKKLKGSIPIDHSVLKEPNNKFLYQLKGGTTIQEVNDDLWKDQSKLADTDQIILNQTGFAELSYIGASSTGAAGSGIRLGPMSNSWLSVHLITIQEKNNEARVVHYRIEPSNGITDAEAWDKQSRSSEVHLIQDDDTFNAVTVSMGSMGIIYSIIVETFPAHNIKEARYRTNWENLDLDALIKENRENKEMESFEVWIQPYEFKGELPVVVTTRYITDQPRHGSRGFLYNVFGDSLAAATLFWLLTSCEQLNWLVPFAMNESLKATVHDEIILPAPMSRNLGPVNYMPGLATANFIPVSVNREAGQALIDMYQQQAAKKNMYVNSPFSFRYTSPGHGLLSMSYDRESVLIESVNLKETFGLADTMARVQETLRGKENFEGRTHWGLVFQGDLLKPDIKEAYPELSKWKEIWQQYNSAGLFVNDFTRQMFGPDAA